MQSVSNVGRHALYTLCRSLAVLALASSVGSVLAQAHEAAPTETSLAASAVNEGRRTVSTLAVHIYPQSGDASATGAVTFVDRGKDGSARQLGAAVVQPDGTATLVTDTLLPGDHAVEATYEGDETHAGSTSSVAHLHTEAAASPDFSLNANPASLNLVAGAFGNVSIALTPINGFSGFVYLSCSGLPLSTTCSFVPANVSVGASGGISTMTIQTTAPAGTAQAAPETTGSAGHGLFYAFLLPGVAGLFGLSRSRKRVWRSMAILLVAGGTVAGLSSCSARYGYFHNPPLSTYGTPAGTSTIMVEATSANGSQVTNHTITLALTVTAKK